MHLHLTAHPPEAQQRQHDHSAQHGKRCGAIATPVAQQAIWGKGESIGEPFYANGELSGKPMVSTWGLRWPCKAVGWQNAQ